MGGATETVDDDLREHVRRQHEPLGQVVTWRDRLLRVCVSLGRWFGSPTHGGPSNGNPGDLSQRWFGQAWRPDRMLHQWPLVLGVIAAIVGVLIASAISTTHWSVFVVWAICLISCVGWIAARGGRWTWVAVVALCAPCFAIRHAVITNDYNEATIFRVVTPLSEPAILEVTIDWPVVLRRHPLADLPSRRNVTPWQTQFEATVNRYRVGQQFQPMTGRVLVVSDGQLSDLRPGDRLQVYGSIRQFAGPSNPGERDLRDVYRRRNLHARVDVDAADQIVLLRRRSLNPMRAVAWFADRSRELLLQHTSESAGPLAVALVIGQRDFVDPDTRDDLLVTGTAHLLSVSGLHLAIIVFLAQKLAMLIRAPQKFEIAWVIGVAVAYCAITGGRPPVLRAAMLISLLMVAIWVGRPSQPINALAFAALILIGYNTHNLFGVGMQLSFLAVATLITCGQRSRSRSPAVQRVLQREERLVQLADSSRSWWVRQLMFWGRAVRQATWFSLCVTATSIPLVWFHFHVVSLVSVATNVLLAFPLFLALASGVATVFGGFFSPMLGDLFGSVCSGALMVMQGIIALSASLPGGHHWLPSPPAWWVATFYGVLAGMMALGDRRRDKVLRRGWVVLWGVAAWWMATTPAPLPDGSIEATFVDVGHGTSVVLRFAKDDVWLYDCGRLANDRGSSRDIDATLWSLGATRIDGVYLSHADSDNYNALPGILRRFGVDQIITPPGMLANDEAGALDATRAAIARSAVDCVEVHADEMVTTGKQTMRVLHPPIGGVGGNDNANSLVLCIDHADRALVLPGDLEPPGTRVLINQPRPRPGGVLMAPHHGSLTMDAESVLQWARPRETVVSGGQRARRVEVREMLAATGSGVQVTASVGAVRVRIDAGGQVEVRNWIQSPW